MHAAFAGYNHNRVRRNLAAQREYSAEIQAFRIGDAGLVSFPVESGLKVKRRSPFHTTFCLGLANDAAGYVPIPEAYPEGGYERPVAQFGPNTAERSGRSAERLLKGLSR